MTDTTDNDARCPDCGSTGYWRLEPIDIRKGWIWHCYGCGAFWSEGEMRNAAARKEE